MSTSGATGLTPLAHARAALVCLTLTTTCGRAETPLRDNAKEKPLEPCAVAERSPSRLHLDRGRPIYVEPISFAIGKHSYLLAGEPLYIWKARAPGEPANLDSSEALLGIIDSQDSIIHGLLRPPVPGSKGKRIADVRFAADANGYAAVFAVTEPRTSGGTEPPLLSYWFGRHDGLAWHSLQRLPLPAGGTLITESASQLIRKGWTFLLAAIISTPRGHDVAVYTVTIGDVGLEILPVRSAAYVALGLAPSASGTNGDPVMYVVRPDSTQTADANSVSAFTRVAGKWQHQGFVIRGGRRPVHQPMITMTPKATILSWLRHDEVLRTRSALAARILPEARLGPTVMLADSVTDAVSMHAAAAPRWVVSRVADSRPTLALVEWDGDAQPVIRDAIVNPYAGPVLAYAVGSPGIGVVVGPLMGQPPREEVVVSAAIEFVSRCRARPPASSP
jgi:hypothetical protein